MRRRPWHPSWLALYGAAAVWLTWPLAAHLGTRLPLTLPTCMLDTLLVAWSLAAQSHALQTDVGAFFHGNAFHPAPWAILHGEAGFGALPFFFPVFALSGNAALATNVTMLAGIVLTAYALHVVVVRWTDDALAGAVAATTLLTTRWLLWTWVPTAPNYAVLCYFPLIVWHAAQPLARWRTVAWLAVLVALQGAVSHYLAVAAMAPLAFLAAGRLLRARTRAAGLRLVAAIGLAALALLPLYGHHLWLRLVDPDLATRTPWRAASVVFRTGLPWGPIAPTSPTAVALPVLAFVLVVGLWRAARTRQEAPADGLRQLWRHGLLWAVVGFVISITPVVRWFDRPIALPHAALAEWVPLWEIVRVPERLRVASLVGLALLAGAATAECGRWLTRRLPRRAPLARLALTALVVAAAYSAYAGAPWPLRHPSVRPLPARYRLQRAVVPQGPILDVLRRPGGALLELPVDDPHRATRLISHARAMFRSTSHWRPLLNGYSGYWPTGHLERMALAARLPDAAALAELRDATQLELVLVHLARLPPARRRVWEALAADRSRRDLTVIAREGHDLLLRVNPAPADAGRGPQAGGSKCTRQG